MGPRSPSQLRYAYVTSSRSPTAFGSPSPCQAQPLPQRPLQSTARFIQVEQVDGGNPAQVRGGSGVRLMSCAVQFSDCCLHDGCCLHSR